MTNKHIIFDLDGTLAATAKATAKAISAVEQTYNLPKITDADIREAMGLAGMEFYQKLFPGVPEETLVNAGREIDNYEDAMIIEIGQEILFQDAYEMLTNLTNKGLALYIASTGSKRHVEATLNAGGIKHFFTEIHCDEPQKIDMVKRIIAGRPTSQWIMVGDMYTDSEAARGNNILALGAGYGYLAEEDKALFDAVLNKPDDIFRHV